MEEPIILYEDNHLLVAVKPQNIPSQEDKSGDKDMLTILKQYIKDKYNKPNNVFLGLVHRLDRPTGGIMVFAKTSKSASRLAEQIQNGEVEKRYLAVSIKKPRNPRGRLVNYLVKDEINNLVRVCPPTIEGAKKAELDYNVLESDNNNLSLLEIKLITGRFHQIRVQLSNIGCPVFADSKYGTQEKGNSLALWAYSLRFTHPVSKQSMVFKVFPPSIQPWTSFPVAKHINVVKPQ